MGLPAAALAPARAAQARAAPAAPALVPAQARAAPAAPALVPARAAPAAAALVLARAAPAAAAGSTLGGVRGGGRGGRFSQCRRAAAWQRGRAKSQRGSAAGARRRRGLSHPLCAASERLLAASERLLAGSGHCAPSSPPPCEALRSPSRSRESVLPYLSDGCGVAPWVLRRDSMPTRALASRPLPQARAWRRGCLLKGARSYFSVWKSTQVPLSCLSQCLACPLCHCRCRPPRGGIPACAIPASSLRRCAGRRSGARAAGGRGRGRGRLGWRLGGAVCTAVLLWCTAVLLRCAQRCCFSGRARASTISGRAGVRSTCRRGRSGAHCAAARRCWWASRRAAPLLLPREVLMAA